MKVSVCLASYNGAAFIRRQLASLLADLEPQDEIILSDDASSDETLAIARDFDDPRIRILDNRDNVRHVRNFERALREASGDVVFLSDQDDIWVAGKRQAVLDVFSEHEDVSMVVHALTLIDSEDRVILERSGAWPSENGGPQPFARYMLRQIVKNQVTGCAVAFRHDLLHLVLPFPPDVYAHDHWLSVAAPFVGRVYFLDKKLLLYRQHDNNVTPKNGLSFTKRVKVRAKLSKLTAIAAIRARRLNPTTEGRGH